MLQINNAGASESKSIERLIEETEAWEGNKAAQERRAKDLEEGKRAFGQYCVHCHGRQGRGDGTAAPYLTPSPRDLSMGIFKFRSTPTNTLPLDRDIYRTIHQGVPGAAMPPWGQILPEKTIRNLVEYIKSLSDRFHRETPDFLIDSGLETPFDAYSLQKGKIIYRELRCDRCHGKEGEREGFLEDSLKDAWGHLSFVYDLRKPGLYKGGASGDAIFRTLTSGMDGTPMSAYDYLSSEERWHVVHFLQAQFKSDPAGEEKAPFARSILSPFIREEIEISPDHPVWKTVPAYPVRLLNLKYRKVHSENIQVQSIHNGRSIAFRLQWNDSRPDQPRAPFDHFLDAVALQFNMEDKDRREAPFFGMGEKGRPVNIWHWKADVNQVVKTPDPKTAALENLNGEGELLSHDYVIDPFRGESVEEMNAAGFGTLSVQSLEDQQLEGRGIWRDGSWSVVLVRPLTTPSPYDARFEPGASVKVAVAVWDGSQRDKNAHKLVSLWQEVDLEKP